jgi:HlyD family secretion protein
MIGTNTRARRTRVSLAGAFLVLGSLAGCSSPDPNRVQGYVEGEYVYVAAPQAGQLEALDVRRGGQVHAGDPLFALDATPERAARDEAKRRAEQALAGLEDARKCKRPTEIESIEAQLRLARAALELSERELDRQEQIGPRASAPQDLDRARSLRDQDRQRVAQLEADLKTARLGSREDQIAAAEANLRATEAALARAEWDLAQKRQAAPQDGMVFDTLYWPGEWVPAGRPVVALLPPQNIKVRFFVPQTRVGSLKVGQTVRVFVDGVAEPYTGKVSYISPKAEYTPPVIYSRESRAKLVFMVEAVFDPQTAVNLHPGQPVDVQLGD